MQSLQSLLARIPAISGHTAYGELICHWSECVGDLAEHMSCAKLVGATLTVHVHNSRWIHELYFLTPEIIRKITQKIPAIKIQDIRYIYKPRITHVEPIDHQEVEISKLVPIRLSPGELKSLESIKDSELRDLLIRYRVYRVHI